MLFNIEVKTLIDEVIVSPYAENWITEAVSSVVQKFGFNFNALPVKSPCFSLRDVDGQKG